MSEQQSDYLIEEINFFSERIPSGVDLSKVYSDLEIFEHIEKPYLTGTLTISESSRFYEKVDVLGGEQILVRLKSTKEDSRAIQKIFYIDRVITAQKSTERDTTIIFHLVEDIKYISTLLNVNESYQGKPSEIIEKIAKIVNKDISVVGSDAQKMKVIVPNMSPLDAASWVKNRATTTNGYPFYLFSTLVGDRLKFIDLGTLISQNPITGSHPLRYYQAAAGSLDLSVRRRTIQNYKLNDVEDLYTMIARGLVGSKYTMINTIDEELVNFDFNIVDDLLKPVTNKLLTGKQKNVLYSPDFSYKDKKFHEIQSRHISILSGAHSYDTSARTFSYREAADKANHKLTIISKAMDAILKKAPMEIGVRGYEFIDGNNHTTIGNNVALEFLSSNPRDPVEEPLIDVKLSGNYMIFASRHIFKKEKHDLVLSCVKLANYGKS